ncbi:hypothetical protein F4824DRAFT_470036 [Ustulina deusta]|nr:hypothetical protein F4824DRAFT_470036 [Ustulina deusta]
MLPPSIRTIEPAFPDYVEDSRRSLLRQMRDTFGWRDRNALPRLSISCNTDFRGPGGSAFGTMTKWYGVSLYEGRPNPFGQDPQTIESTALTPKKKKKKKTRNLERCLDPWMDSNGLTGNWWWGGLVENRLLGEG